MDRLDKRIQRAKAKAEEATIKAFEQVAELAASSVPKLAAEAIEITLSEDATVDLVGDRVQFRLRLNDDNSYLEWTASISELLTYELDLYCQKDGQIVGEEEKVSARRIRDQFSRYVSMIDQRLQSE